MNNSKSIRELYIAAGAGILIITWIAILMKLVVPHLATFSFGGISYTALGSFIFICIVTPLWEELFFRYVPFEIMKKVNKFTKQDFTKITLVLSSIVFALSHENNGILAIIYQGFGGFIIGLIYLISKRSYLCSVITHAIWNISAVYILPEIW